MPKYWYMRFYFQNHPWKRGSYLTFKLIPSLYPTKMLTLWRKVVHILFIFVISWCLAECLRLSLPSTNWAELGLLMVFPQAKAEHRLLTCPESDQWNSAGTQARPSLGSPDFQGLVKGDSRLLWPGPCLRECTFSCLLHLMRTEFPSFS